jgi:hypothetical protein
MTETTKSPAAPLPPPASAVDGAKLTDALFGSPLEPDKPAPTVNVEDLAVGAIVYKMGERVVTFPREGKTRKATIHIFSPAYNRDRWFSLFGSANLDSQIRKVRPGAAILITYSGKHALDDGSGRELHTWQIRQTQANPAQLQQLLGTGEWQLKVQALDLAITQAAQREQERRAAGRSPEAPPLTDADFHE